MRFKSRICLQVVVLLLMMMIDDVDIDMDRESIYRE
jgi:hypothetical protein